MEVSRVYSRQHTPPPIMYFIRINRNGIAIIENVKDELEELPMLNSKASNELLSRITVDPDVSHGKPSIRGLRYSVELILELLSSGMSVDEVLEDYDDLEREDIHAALLYAAKLSQVKSIQKIA